MNRSILRHQVSLIKSATILQQKDYGSAAPISRTLLTATSFNLFSRLKFFSEAQCIQQIVNVSQDLESSLGYPVGDTRISERHLGDQPAFKKELEILLQLEVTHVGAVHYLRLARFSEPEHVSDYFYARPSSHLRQITPVFITSTIIPCLSIG
jgi:hypothetical protein